MQLFDQVHVSWVYMYIVAQTYRSNIHVQARTNTQTHAQTDSHTHRLTHTQTRAHTGLRTHRLTHTQAHTSRGSQHSRSFDILKRQQQQQPSTTTAENSDVSTQAFSIRKERSGYSSWIPNNPGFPLFGPKFKTVYTAQTQNQVTFVSIRVLGCPGVLTQLFFSQDLCSLFLFI